MWTCALLLACLAALSAATPLLEESDRSFKASDDFLQKQLQVMQLFLWPYDTLMYDSFASIVKSYKLEDNFEHFQDSKAVRKFVALDKAHAFFPKSKVFTTFEYRPREEAKLIFEMLYYAKDFDTFFKTAVYTREKVNKGLFHYVIRTVLGMREDTKYFYYPASYEIYPQTFLDERVIQKARDAKIRALQTGDHHQVVIPANYTGYWDAERHPESVLAYFREDLGLNMLNVAFHTKYPAWFDSSHYGKHNDRKGELFLHYLRQLAARYYLERLSNNLEEVWYISAEEPLDGYFPNLRYSNGEQVTPRQPFTMIRDTKQISLAEHEENVDRVRQAINLGYAKAENGTHASLRGEDGLDILGEMIGFVGDNINYKYYDSVYYQALYLLGAGDEKIPPSALLRLETALRDPLYYQNIDTFFRDYLYEYATTLPKHTYDDIAFSGLTVESADVDKLITFFEDFHVDLLPVTGYGIKYEDNKVDVLANLRRLNHLPFSYRVSVNSDKEADVIVKVFITPKYDPQGRTLPMDTRMIYSFEIDRFPAKVTAGKNVIQRKSHESTVAVGDHPTFKQMWNKTHDALNGKETFVVDKFARPYGFPQNLLLPKGNKYGLPVQFVVAVFPYEEASSSDRMAYDLQSFTLLGTDFGVKFPDPRPIDFPVDRPFRSEYDAQVPNIFAKEVRVFHKTLDEIHDGTQ